MLAEPSRADVRGLHARRHSHPRERGRKFQSKSYCCEIAIDWQRVFVLDPWPCYQSHDEGRWAGGQAGTCAAARVAGLLVFATSAGWWRGTVTVGDSKRCAGPFAVP